MREDLSFQYLARKWYVSINDIMCAETMSNGHRVKICHSGRTGDCWVSIDGDNAQDKDEGTVKGILDAFGLNYKEGGVVLKLNMLKNKVGMILRGLHSEAI